MFWYLIVLSCVFNFSYTKPQNINTFHKTVSYFDNLRKDLEFRPGCNVTLNTSSVLAPCDRPIPPDVKAADFMFDFEMFLCMGVYDSILRVCDMKNKHNTTEVMSLLALQKSVQQAEDFCEKLQEKYELLNSSYTQTSEWVTILKGRFRVGGCHRACTDSSQQSKIVGVNPLCYYMYQAALLFNLESSINGSTTKVETSNTAEEEPKPAVDKYEVDQIGASGIEDSSVADKSTAVEIRKAGGDLTGKTYSGPNEEKKTVAASVPVSDNPTSSKGKDTSELSSLDSTKPMVPTKNNQSVNNGQPNASGKQPTSNSANDSKPAPEPSQAAGKQPTSNSANDAKPAPEPSQAGGKQPTSNSASDAKPPTVPSQAGGKQPTSNSANDSKPAPEPSQAGGKQPTSNSVNDAEPAPEPSQAGGKQSTSNSANDAKPAPEPSQAGGKQPTSNSANDPKPANVPSQAGGKQPTSNSANDAKPANVPSQADSKTPLDTKGKNKQVSGASPEETPRPKNDDPFVGAEDSHFFVYFVTMVVLCIIGYLAFHNKQKILALTLEGYSRRNTRRRQHTKYKKLDSNLEEAVTSSCKQSTTSIIY